MATIGELFRRLARHFGVSQGAGQAPRDELSHYRLLAENSIDVVFRFGADGRARYISPSAERLFGAPPDQLRRMGRDAEVNPFLHPDDRPAVVEAIRRHFRGEVDEHRMEFRVLRVDGEPVWVETNCRTIYDPRDGRPSDIVLTMRDISEKKSFEARLAELANADALTGLANRRAFDQTLEREWKRALRSGSELSLLVMDVDHFKRFNDSYGHQAGDECLCSVAAAIRGQARRAGDLAARFGGDEFAVILPETDRDRAVDMAWNICRKVEELALSRPGPGPGVRATVSIGAASTSGLTGRLEMPRGLFEAADLALYRAKARGRNRVECAAPTIAGRAVRSAS
jgi:diguanylate cyclase (GGDEF)-like protein/PAS domain S-box-containing protein